MVQEDEPEHHEGEREERPYRRQQIQPVGADESQQPYGRRLV